MLVEHTSNGQHTWRLVEVVMGHLALNDRNGLFLGTVKLNFRLQVTLTLVPCLSY